MGIKSTEVSYNFGQLGSAFNDGVAVMRPPTGKVFIAITMLADTVFNSTDGLVADNNITSGIADVIVTDGFTGNISLKTAEGFSKFMSNNFKKIFTN